MNRAELAEYLDTLLRIDDFSDYAPNGLQVEGREEIHTIATGVSANQALIDAAVEANADALIVHHGFFWKNEPRTIVGHRMRRIRTLLDHGLSLFGYHLPLDAHDELGNNVGLLRAVGASPTELFSGVGWHGRFEGTRAATDVIDELAAFLGRDPVVRYDAGPDRVERIAICTGRAPQLIEEAAAGGAQLFVTGEPGEPTQGLARELEINFAAFGHHATERIGVRLLGEHLREEFDLSVTFIDIENPV